MSRTEKVKMLAGELYDASDPELASERKRARRLTRLYNATTEDEDERRDAILRELLGTVEGYLKIEPPFQCDYGAHIHIGAGVFINFGCVILDCNTVRIGRNVQIGPGVHIYAAYHPVEAAARIAGPELAAPVTIGDNAWIGGGAIICAGVTIGENTTIGSGGIVVKDIPANVVAAGNPCRVIRTLTP